MVIVLPDTLQTLSDTCPNPVVARVSELTSGSPALIWVSSVQLDFSVGFLF
jgi:hypothetical protein